MADQPHPIELEQPRCGDIDAAVTPEWLLSNGIGGYACGSVSGVLDRRYHGLLVAPVDLPLGRHLLFAKADVVAVLDNGEAVALHSNRWGGGAVEPQGYARIARFFLDRHLPVWHFRIGDRVLEQRIWMRHGHNQTFVAFRLIGGSVQEPLHLRIGLIASYRDHHAVNGHPGPAIERTLDGDDRLRLTLPNGQSVALAATAGRFELAHDWIDNFFLTTEHERGLEEIDRHPRVGFVDIEATGQAWTGIAIAFEEDPVDDLAGALDAERRRIDRLTAGALPGVGKNATPAWIRQLVIASDAYLFKRQTADGAGHDSVIAGFPWFGDWGRDTMIALPGLTLATGRAHLGKAILETFAGYVSQGMLPNVFPGRGETPDYNTVDAALWFIEAWRSYIDASGDLAALRDVFPTLVRIIAAYRSGTRYGIALDPLDGLMRAGTPGQQLTWMDARAAGREVTPRHGKPVEINALWFNALRSMTDFAGRIGAPSDMFSTLAEQAAAGFARFVRDNTGGLFDVIDGPDGDDPTVRPNQLFAVSLTHSPIDDAAVRRRIVSECRAQLLTPFGLRSLSPDDSRYSGRYTGGVDQRDGSYHQGPAWGWLLGHFALADFRVNGDAPAAQQLLAPLAEQLTEAAIGQLGEIFDGDAPHLARGAPAQAWSVACTLEAWWRLEHYRQVAARDASTPPGGAA